MPKGLTLSDVPVVPFFDYHLTVPWVEEAISIMMPYNYVNSRCLVTTKNLDCIFVIWTED